MRRIWADHMVFRLPGVMATFSSLNCTSANMSINLPPTIAAPQDRDRATQSNYTQVKVNHTHLEWVIDWKRKVFEGFAVLSVEALDKISAIVLDTSYLEIKSVNVDGKDLKWTIGERKGTIGSALSFGLALDKGHKTDIKITYNTTPECTAVGWLEPVQTKSGKYPYLYSQSQAVSGEHMRT